MAMTIDSEMSAFGIQQDLNIFTFETLANKEGLAEEMHIAMFGDLAEEGNPSGSNGQRLVWDEIVEWQFSQFGSPAILHRGQAIQTRLHMLRIDRFFQALQFALESAGLSVVPLE